MNFSEVFIQRPIATSLLMAAIALFGVVAYHSLPVSDMPNVDMPVIQVQASLPGADPATMASSVATVLERQFTTIAGIDPMRSGSQAGNTQIPLQFDINRDIDGASVDVQTAIAEAHAAAAGGHADSAFVPQEQSRRRSDRSAVLDVARRCRCGNWTITRRTMIAPRISMMSGVSQVRCRAPPSMRSACSWIRTSWWPRRSASTKSPTRSAAGIRIRPPGTLYGPQQAYNSRPTASW